MAILQYFHDTLNYIPHHAFSNDFKINHTFLRDYE